MASMWLLDANEEKYAENSSQGSHKLWLRIAINIS